ncbi:MAG: TIGR02757 family protein [Chitinophagaceae bacterium]|nr:TIGR02757 family protein [Chitinophagaceae bacterium]
MLSTRDFGKLKQFLDEKVEEYNVPGFIEDDPISIPHRFTEKQDIEIAALFAAVFAWGNRKTIIKKCTELLDLMDNAPHQFCLDHADTDLKPLSRFVHRTFNSDDLLYFIEFFKYHYTHNDSLESAFFNKKVKNAEEPVEAGLNHFYDYFFSLPWVSERTRKHIAAPKRNSACKRLNMFLRWTVRNDKKGVDLGLWKKVKPADLICPLDVHVSRVARRMGLLERKQNDWKAAMELTTNLRLLDPKDPVKYDYALFGLGVNERKI